MTHRYVFRVDCENEVRLQEFIAHWRKGSELIQQQAGSLGTRLHSVKDSPLSLIAIAEWESKAIRDAAMKENFEGQDERAKAWRSIPRNDSFGTITILGELDEIGFVPPSH